MCLKLINTGKKLLQKLLLEKKVLGLEVEKGIRKILKKVKE